MEYVAFYPLKYTYVHMYVAYSIEKILLEVKLIVNGMHVSTDYRRISSVFGEISQCVNHNHDKVLHILAA